MQLASGTPAALGQTVAFEVSGAPPLAAGALGVALGSASLPLFPGGTLLIDPLSLTLTPPLDHGADGVGSAGVDLPAGQQFDGEAAYLQAFAVDTTSPENFLLSSGLELVLCFW